MSLALSGPFNHVGGSCWNITLPPEDFPDADGPGDPSSSCLLLREDGRELGPPHTAHQLLIRDGGGAYSHWCDVLWFSTSDNSDPNRNGRAYTVEVDLDRYFRRRADYALDTVRSWAQRLPGGLEAFRGRAVLEIGPGRDMGTVLVMAALGARSVHGVDRFQGAWREGWHDAFIETLKGVLGRLEAQTDPSVLDLALSARSFGVGGVRMASQAFEALNGQADAFDISVSHSTFEHFYSVEEAARALAACTRDGGVGVHNVDFRDHANFAQPLDFLLIDDATYADPAVNSDYGRGNRVRPEAMAEMLLRAGFRQVEFISGQQAEPGYVAGILEARARCGTPPLAGGDDGLGTLSGTFVLRK